MDKKYNIGIIGYSWAASAHIGAGGVSGGRRAVYEADADRPGV